MTAWAGGESATTRYELEGGRVLTAIAGDLTTTYLYGMGPVAELTDSWAYSLPDGANTQRQLTDSVGDVTLISSYTPWGDTLTAYGTGSFSYGYFGGIMDNATGLLYVGNGQYYDPATGRFLNRNARPEQTNPYVPWKSDPTGALISPLVLLALFFANRKKRGKWETVSILLILCIGLGMTVSACIPISINPPDNQNENQNPFISIPNPIVLFYVQDGSVVEYYVSHGDPAVNLPTINCWITLINYSEPGYPNNDVDDHSVIDDNKESSITLSPRASDIKGWADELYISPVEVFAMDLQHEASDAWTVESENWFSGVPNDPALTDPVNPRYSKANDPSLLYEEAGTRWYYSWIYFSDTTSRFGKAVTREDRELMMFNWIVENTQSEDGFSKSIMADYHSALDSRFVGMAERILKPEHPEWAKGNGMWSWANLYLYERPGRDYLSDWNRSHFYYRYGTGTDKWYIFGMAAVDYLNQYRKGR